MALHRSATARRHLSSERLVHRARRRSWCRRKSSITASLFDDKICSWQYAITEDLLAAGREIRKLHGHFAQLGRNDAAYYFIPVSEFDRFPRPQPCLELASVPQLTNVHVYHDLIVAHPVSHRQVRELDSVSNCRRFVRWPLGAVIHEGMRE